MSASVRMKNNGPAMRCVKTASIRSDQVRSEGSLCLVMVCATSLTLRDLEGLTGEETAEAMELSLAAMKSRLHRGRLHLMGVLRAAEVDDA